MSDQNTEVSEAEPSAKAPHETALEILRGILERMEIPASVSMSEVDEKFVLDIQCEDEDDVQRVIGRRGQVIDALQHVVGKAVSRFRDEEYKPVIVDAADYRRRHIERLEGLAERMAEKARSSGRPVDLNPMPAHDRRIIHMALAEESGVETRSEGEGMDRHIVVFPTD